MRPSPKNRSDRQQRRHPCLLVCSHNNAPQHRCECCVRGQALPLSRLPPAALEVQATLGRPEQSGFELWEPKAAWQPKPAFLRPAREPLMCLKIRAVRASVRDAGNAVPANSVTRKENTSSCRATCVDPAQ